MKNHFPKRGEIWLIDLSRSEGSEQSGIRPCIAIEKSQGKTNTTIIIPASRTRRDCTYDLGKYELLLNQVRVVDTGRLIKRLSRFERKPTDDLCLALYKYLCS